MRKASTNYAKLIFDLLKEAPAVFDAEDLSECTKSIRFRFYHTRRGIPDCRCLEVIRTEHDSVHDKNVKLHDHFIFDVTYAGSRTSVTGDDAKEIFFSLKELFNSKQ